MGKIKRRSSKNTTHRNNSHQTKSLVQRRQHSQAQQGPISQKSKAVVANGQQNKKPKIPFYKDDNLLLVGEGDFSFAHSLLHHHRLAQVTATCYDSKDQLEAKYSEVKKNIVGLRHIKSQDYNPSTDKIQLPIDSESEWEGLSPREQSPTPVDSHPGNASDVPRATILYSIDATKLSTTHRKALRPFLPFTKIVFNFPHVGGLSTDVNRQVRSNQQLLVGFFNSAKTLLSLPDKPFKLSKQQLSDDSTDDDSHKSDTIDKRTETTQFGQILVTLFEGEPYTLWNIRDLARHCGLQVVESFKFPWSAYPGYQHARTVGEITSGIDRTSEGKRKGAWRGEERSARCYVLQIQSEYQGFGGSARHSAKRKASMEDEESG